MSLFILFLFMLIYRFQSMVCKRLQPSTPFITLTTNTITVTFTHNNYTSPLMSLTHSHFIRSLTPTTSTYPHSQCHHPLMSRVQIHLVVKLEKELDAPDQYKDQEVSYKRIKTQNEELERALEKHGVSPVVDYTDKETKTM